MNKQRVRFGIKTGSWLFPNAGVVVFYMNLTNWLRFLELVEQGKALLPPEIAKRIVCEAS